MSSWRVIAEKLEAAQAKTKIYTLFGLFFSTIPSRSASTSREISVKEQRQVDENMFSLIWLHIFLMYYRSQTHWLALQKKKKFFTVVSFITQWHTLNILNMIYENP